MDKPDVTIASIAVARIILTRGEGTPFRSKAVGITYAPRAIVLATDRSATSLTKAISKAEGQEDVVIEINVADTRSATAFVVSMEVAVEVHQVIIFLRDTTDSKVVDSTT